jgi:hypothetical protein
MVFILQNSTQDSVLGFSSVKNDISFFREPVSEFNRRIIEEKKKVNARLLAERAEAANSINASDSSPAPSIVTLDHK